MKEEPVIGRGRPILDAALKVTGQKQYTADLRLPGMLYGRLLLSPVAHARIRSIDTSQAENLPGVRAVATYLNSPRRRYNSAKRMIGQSVIETERIFDDTVRHVGDRVAAVAADTPEIAARAVKRIRVEYEPLPLILSPEQAKEEGAFPIHEGGNIACSMQAGEEIPDDVFDSCDLVLERTYETQAVHQAAIEPHAALADWDASGHLTLWAPSQNTFAWRVILSEIFELPMNRVRVIEPAIGGGFGGKLELTVEPAAAWLSYLAGRPVRLTLDRKETILATRVRNPSVSRVKTGFMKDGTLRAMDIRITLDTGAYATSAANVAGALLHKVFLMYKTPHIHIRSESVYTNHIPSGAMRGYGSPQVYFGVERQMNTAARMLGLDPAYVQEKNLVLPDARNPLNGEPIGNPRPLDALFRAEELFGYDEALRRAEKSRAENGRFLRGVGVAVGAHGNNCYGVHRDNASPMIRMNEDGTAVLYTGSHDMGTDTLGMQVSVIEEVLGITPDRVTVVAADTDTVLWHIGDYSSRGTFVIGRAVQKAAQKVRDELAGYASEILKVPAGRLVFQNNRIRDKDHPETCIILSELMTRHQEEKRGEICRYVTYEAVRSAASYGAHIAEVIVDRETGEVTLEKYAAVQDAGTVLNPMMITGQLQGAVLMGIGYALYEQISYDSSGVPKQQSFKRYRVGRVTDLPRKLLTDFVRSEEGEPDGPYGAKALGESPVVPVAPAIANAISNALEVECNSLPVTAEKIREVLASC